VLGYAGRLLPIKGTAELVEAWRRLREEFPEAHLLLVGDYDPRDRLPPGVVEALQADPRAHVTGWLTDVAPLYAVMDVFVLPSYHEGFSTVCLEAAAMTLPVVTTAVPGNVDAVLDGQTGRLVPVRDPPALAEAVRAYLRDPELRASHGRAGRERVLRDFRPEPIAEATCAEYVELLREKGLAVPPPRGP
jgi:glycosyltransferase involved in cell wall biosynthesis